MILKKNIKGNVVSPNSNIIAMLESTGVCTLSNITTMSALPLCIPETLKVGKRAVVFKVHSIFIPNLVISVIKKILTNNECA